MQKEIQWDVFSMSLPSAEHMGTSNRTRPTSVPSLLKRTGRPTAQEAFRWVWAVCIFVLLPGITVGQLDRSYAATIPALTNAMRYKALTTHMRAFAPEGTFAYDTVAHEVTMRIGRLITLAELNTHLASTDFVATALVQLGDVTRKAAAEVTEADLQRFLDLPLGHEPDQVEYARLKAAWIANDPEGYQRKLHAAPIHPAE